MPRKNTCEIVFKCNDRWLNSHCIAGFLGWGANIDMSILIDSTSVIEYVAKYCNKTETASKGLSNILRSVVQYANETGEVETSTLLRKCLNRRAGRRDKCTQETAHLILSRPIAVCSHTLFSLLRKINPSENDDETPALKCNIIDAYKFRCLKESLFIAIESQLPDIPDICV
jgi:hypothetical protein